MSALADDLEAIADDERRRAVRALLRHPFLTVESDAEFVVLVRRHRDSLAAWFQAELGYRLVVDSDFARLLKTSTSLPLARRHLTTRSGLPFDPRRYTLLCLVLAALEQTGEQTTLERLAEAVKLHAADVEHFDLDFDRIADRRAFTHAVQAVADLGIVDFRDGDEERFARKEEGGDALYQVRHRRLAQVLAAPVPPSGVDLPGDIVKEAYADTSEGRARASRHRVMRILVEESVCYFESLREEDRLYYTSQRARIFRQLERMCGFEVELRDEGVAAVDRAGDTSDLAFPSEGTVAHAALLLADHLARKHREGEDTSTMTGLETMISGLVPQYRKYWRADLAADPAELTRLALDRLDAFRLIERIEGGVRPLAAIGRFAAAPAAEQAEEVQDDADR